MRGREFSRPNILCFIIRNRTKNFSLFVVAKKFRCGIKNFELSASATEHRLNYPSNKFGWALFQSYLARRLTKRKTIEKQAIQSVRLANTKATNVTARHMLRFFRGLLFWRMTHIWKFVSDPMASVANNVTVTREEEVEQSSVVFHATHETFDVQNVNNWTATDRSRSKCFISGLVRAHFRSDYNAICSFVSSIRPPLELLIAMLLCAWLARPLDCGSFGFRKFMTSRSRRRKHN